MFGQKPVEPFGPEEIRQPAWAGRFYPAEADECQAMARRYVTAGGEAPAGMRKPLGGIVPHAGWVCSGAVAGQAMAAIARGGAVDVVVVFGAIHTPLPTEIAALASHARWAVPGGEFEVARQVERKLLEEEEAFCVDDRFHVREHAVEVELPLIQQAWPGAMVLPVQTPVVSEAADYGARTARRIAEAGLSAVYLASSDLTHYGPDYGFAPKGIGLGGIEWAKGNDRRLLDLVERMEVERIVPEVQQHLNACGAGAIAAMLGACREMGAGRAAVLRHTNSYETLLESYPQEPINAVGYAAVVVG